MTELTKIVILPRIEKVYWIDSGCSGGWHNPKMQDYTPMDCVTCGFVIEENDVSIAIAGSYDSENQVSEVMIIPKVCIKNRVVLMDGNSSLSEEAP